MDEQARAAERAAATGDVQAAAKVLAERIRAGTLTRDEVIDLAATGDAAALFFLNAPDKHIAGLMRVGTKKLDVRQAFDALTDYYRSMGLRHDAHGALVSPESDKKRTRIKFLQRAVQVFQGRPGAWVKIASESPIRLIEQLLASTRTPDQKAKIETRERKTVERRKTAIKKEDALRLGVVSLSLEATPEERGLSLDPDADVYELGQRAAGLASVEQVPDKNAVATINGMLSSDTPPLMLFRPRTRELLSHMPESFTWTEDGVEVEISRKERGWPVLSLNIGAIPINPITLNIDPERMFNGPYNGVSLVIRARDGGVRVDLRVLMGDAVPAVKILCRILGGYGIPHFVASRLLKEEAESLLAMHDSGLLDLKKLEDGVVICRCAPRIKDDPAQLLLFNRKR